MEKIQNNIVFSNVKMTGIGISAKPLVFKNNGEYKPGEINEFGGIINAVDIDWNGAKLDTNTTITYTGDLLSYISALGVSVSELSNILKTPITTEEPSTTQPTTQGTSSGTTESPTPSTTD